MSSDLITKEKDAGRAGWLVAGGNINEKAELEPSGKDQQDLGQ